MTEPWTITLTGQHVKLLDPQPETINIYDIAISAARTCRFNGQTIMMYTVAPHCMLTALIVEALKLKNALIQAEEHTPLELLPIPALMLQALIHDASDAYVGDVISPLKRELSDFIPIEARFQEVIFNKYGLQTAQDPYVHVADQIAQALEAIWYTPLCDHPDYKYGRVEVYNQMFQAKDYQSLMEHIHETYVAPGFNDEKLALAYMRTFGTYKGAWDRFKQDEEEDE